MPCILKQQTITSPGIITFTHNEVLWGLPHNSQRVQDFLLESHRSGKWIFGVHIQGDCSFLDSWPLAPWQSFVMWPDPKAHFLSNLPDDKFCPFTCVNFMPAYLAEINKMKRLWDICVISRASSLKRLDETLLLLREVLDLRPETKIAIIVPDPRYVGLGEQAYKKQGINEDYFKIPKALFSARELKQISFISSSQESFGNFPLAGELVAEILKKSKFLFLNSYQEGVPRVIAEALMLGTPCIISDRLKSGLNDWLTDSNSLRIPDQVEKAAYQIVQALKRYEEFNVNQEASWASFSEEMHIQGFKSYLTNLIQSRGIDEDGLWFLEDLHLRLACHGQKRDFQFFHNENIFFKWVDQALKIVSSDADEDFLLLGSHESDSPSLYFKVREFFCYLSSLAIKQLRKLVSRN